MELRVSKRREDENQQSLGMKCHRSEELSRVNVPAEEKVERESNTKAF